LQVEESIEDLKASMAGLQQENKALWQIVEALRREHQVRGVEMDGMRADLERLAASVGEGLAGSAAAAGMEAEEEEGVPPS
jgi:hypothetical protein